MQKAVFGYVISLLTTKRKAELLPEPRLLIIGVI